MASEQETVNPMSTKSRTGYSCVTEYFDQTMNNELSIS